VDKNKALHLSQLQPFQPSLIFASRTEGLVWRPWGGGGAPALLAIDMA
jgi:hypothetical protein